MGLPTRDYSMFAMKVLLCMALSSCIIFAQYDLPEVSFEEVADEATPSVLSTFTLSKKTMLKTLQAKGTLDVPLGSLASTEWYTRNKHYIDVADGWICWPTGCLTAKCGRDSVSNKERARDMTRKYRRNKACKEKVAKHTKETYSKESGTKKDLKRKGVGGQEGEDKKVRKARERISKETSKKRELKNKEAA